MSRIVISKRLVLTLVFASVLSSLAFADDTRPTPPTNATNQRGPEHGVFQPRRPGFRRTELKISDETAVLAEKLLNEVAFAKTNQISLLQDEDPFIAKFRKLVDDLKVDRGQHLANREDALSPTILKRLWIYIRKTDAIAKSMEIKGTDGMKQQQAYRQRNIVMLSGRLKILLLEQLNAQNTAKASSQLFRSAANMDSLIIAYRIPSLRKVPLTPKQLELITEYHESLRDLRSSVHNPYASESPVNGFFLAQLSLLNKKVQAILEPLVPPLENRTAEQNRLCTLFEELKNELPPVPKPKTNGTPLQ